MMLCVTVLDNFASECEFVVTRALTAPHRTEGGRRLKEAEGTGGDRKTSSH